MGKCITKAIQIYLGTSRHNQAYPRIMQIYSVIIRTLCNLVCFMKLWMLLLVLIVSCIFRTLLYPESRHIQCQKHIQNPGIFKILVSSGLWYPGIFRTLVYSKPEAYPDFIYLFYLFNAGKKNIQLRVSRRNSFSIKRKC